VRSHVFLLKRTLFVILTEKLFLLRRGISLSFRQRSCFCFDEESLCHSDREAVFASTKNPVVIPTEKFFCFDEESLCFRQAKILQSLNSSFRMTLTKCHSDREVFLLRRGIFLSFRQRSFCFDEESLCHSDREAVFASTRNLFVIPTEKFFCFDEESICHSDREAVFASTRNLFVIPTEKLFLL
jgi:hypothetical protein